jgi:hypothetical protein
MYKIICVYIHLLKNTFQWFVPLQQADFTCCISKTAQYLFI